MRRMMRLLACALAALSCGVAAKPPGEQESEAIAGAGDWVLLRRLPGIPGLVCTIRSEGPEANTTIVLNDDRVPVLILGRGDWGGLAGSANVSVSIDGAPPVALEASMAHNLVVVGPVEAALMGRLGGARSVEWRLPFGNFRAGVAGLDVALDALAACRPDPEG